MVRSNVKHEVELDDNQRTELEAVVRDGTAPARRVRQAPGFCCSRTKIDAKDTGRTGISPNAWTSRSGRFAASGSSSSGKG